MCANFILPCGENHYGFFLRCPTSFYNRPKKTDISPKTLEKPAEIKPTPTPEQKKPEDTPKTAAPTEKIDADGKKPDVPPKPPEKATVEKPAPTPALKQPEEKPKAVTRS